MLLEELRPGKVYFAETILTHEVDECLIWGFQSGSRRIQLDRYRRSLVCHFSR
jgi:hypothetical protein